MFMILLYYQKVSKLYSLISYISISICGINKYEQYYNEMSNCFFGY